MPTKEQMYEYGYTWDEMTPISIDMAEQLYDKYELFLLYTDDTEAVVYSRDEMHEHVANGGMIGVETSDLKM